jgi:hypothetical protein
VPAGATRLATTFGSSADPPWGRRGSAAERILDGENAVLEQVAELPVGAQPAAAPIEIDPRSRRRPLRLLKRVQRGFVWLFVLTALIVAAGVLLQAFSIAAYVRGAGPEALDLHQTGGIITHSVEIVVFLTALIGYWGSWTRIGLALLLPVIGTIQAC